MNESDPLVCVIDDEPSVRKGLSNLLRSAGLKVQTFASAKEFLINPPREGPSCLVLDVNLPGTSGLDLQAELANGAAQIPIINSRLGLGAAHIQDPSREVDAGGDCDIPKIRSGRGRGIVQASELGIADVAERGVVAY